MGMVLKTNFLPSNWIPWLDGIALLFWGILLLKYTFTGEYLLLIHPNYYGLVLGSGIVLTILGILQIKVNLSQKTNSSREHLALFPPGLSSSVLILVAIAGLIIPPRILNSQTALKRGVSELPLTNVQPEAFRTPTKPEERSLIEWIRTINAYPEPDAYQGQPAKVTGFVLHLEELPANYLMLSRFVITCCAVDAYPIGIPVKLETSRQAYEVDSWLEVTGVMTTEMIPTKDRVDSAMITNQRSVVLKAESIQSIPTPRDPYNYR